MTIQAVHGFAVAAGNGGVVDGLVVNAWNSSAAAGESDRAGDGFAAAQQGWTVRNAVVMPQWVAVAAQADGDLATGGAVTAVTVGPEHGLGFEAYGVSVPLAFSGSCTAAASAAVNADGSLGTVTVSAGGVGCSGDYGGYGQLCPGTYLPARPVKTWWREPSTPGVPGREPAEGAMAGTRFGMRRGRGRWGRRWGGGGTLTASSTAVRGAGGGSLGAEAASAAERVYGVGEPV